MTIKLIVDTRQRMYAHILPKEAIVAELGVSRGHNAFDLIVPLSNPKEFHLIDDWRYPNDMNRNKSETWACQANAKKEASTNKNCIIHVGDTVEVMETFEDEYFDWIYVDGDHRYEGVMRDLIVSSKKVKKDGFIAGHDYEVYTREDKRKWGVKKAVDEFCLKYDYELTYLTSNQKEAPSYILEKIK